MKAKRFLTALLVLSMLITLLPTAFAAKTTELSSVLGTDSRSAEENLPADGDEIVIFNASAEAVIGISDEFGCTMTVVSATVTDGAASVSNGGLVFTAHVYGSDYSFETGGKFLAADENENIFLTDDETAHIYWNLEKSAGGYIMYNKDAVYTFFGGGSAKICIEYSSDAFTGWTYKSDSKEIFEFNFYPVAEDAAVINGVVNAPSVKFTSPDSKRVGEDYTLSFELHDLAESITAISVGYDIGVAGGELDDCSPVGNTYSVTVKSEWLDFAKSAVFTVYVENCNGLSYNGKFTVNIIDEPYISEITPADNSETGEEKRPVISAVIGNAGDNPTVLMTINDKEVQGVYINGIYSYTPDEDLADGSYTVVVTVERTDGAVTSKSWSFKVGDTNYNPVKITDIAEVQQQTEAGYKYTIEGTVTTNASGYDKNTAFFDCIYVQDETGGVCCVPVTGDYKIGDKVRVTGTTDFYRGEMELRVTEIEKIGEGEPVATTEVGAAAVNDGSVLGRFISVSGTVQGFELSDGLVQTIYIEDIKGDVARVFIDSYICSDVTIENLEVGGNITVSGVASYDNTFNAPNGPFPRIRINDRKNIVCTPAPEDPFTDIAGSGYHDNIVAAANAGIINGYPDGTYRPNADVTRAQFITMLYRSVGSPTVTGSLSFNDGSSVAAVYKDAVVWGVQNGIILGYDDNTFRPNQNISRAQMATFLYRYLKNVEYYDFSSVENYTLSFADKDSIAAPYVEAVNAIVSVGVMNGTSTLTFAPNSTANRGMAATVILRVYNLTA